MGIVLKKVELEKLYQRFPSFNINGRLITERYYALSEDHVLLLAMPPFERYKKKKAEYPWILSHPGITTQMQADYLSIDRTTLSRYRNNGKY